MKRLSNTEPNSRSSSELNEELGGEPNAQPDYVPYIRLADYSYSLPDEQIAFQPLNRRDESRLLVCDSRDGSITHQQFSGISELLPSGATLVLNDTRVVRGRLHLYKASGGKVEILLGDPIEPSSDPAVALAAQGETLWRCMVGGLKKIRNGGEVQGEFQVPGGNTDEHGKLRAVVEQVGEDGVSVRFRWSPASLSFAEAIEAIGHVPLPPYIKREDKPEDVASYQTVYAEHEGAVAAPTAGLHFTQEVLAALRAKNINLLSVTLHVGAGTFAPVKGDYAVEHTMHGERIALPLSTLKGLIRAARRREWEGSPLVIVGTTSLRTLESLYWFGVKLMRNEIPVGASELAVNQWDPYRLQNGAGETRSGEGETDRSLSDQDQNNRNPELPFLSVALEHIEKWGVANDFGVISGVTRLMILPGYRFKACDALITNFHQPGSTLILLVAAFLGDRLWRRVYDEGISRGYRFLSYGDSSLLIGRDARF